MSGSVGGTGWAGRAGRWVARAAQGASAQAAGSVAATLVLTALGAHLAGAPTAPPRAGAPASFEGKSFDGKSSERLLMGAAVPGAPAPAAPVALPAAGNGPSWPLFALLSIGTVGGNGEVVALGHVGPSDAPATPAPRRQVTSPTIATVAASAHSPAPLPPPRPREVAARDVPAREAAPPEAPVALAEAPRPARLLGVDLPGFVPRGADVVRAVASLGEGLFGDGTPGAAR